MTVMRTSSSSDSSIPAPKMMFASLSAAWMMSCAASLMSTIDMFTPPVTFMSTARAPSMEVSSMGLDTAFFAASIMLFSPLPTPMPMWAIPPDSMTVLTSAKSRLISAGTAIRSEMPWMPWRSTSSAILNASIIVVPLVTTCKSRSLGMTTRVSTRCIRS